MQSRPIGCNPRYIGRSKRCVGAYGVPAVDAMRIRAYFWSVNSYVVAETTDPMLYGSDAFFYCCIVFLEIFIIVRQMTVLVMSTVVLEADGNAPRSGSTLYLLKCLDRSMHTSHAYLKYSRVA